jgi:hypothetical protein
VNYEQSNHCPAEYQPDQFLAQPKRQRLCKNSIPNASMMTPTISYLQASSAHANKKPEHI